MTAVCMPYALEHNVLGATDMLVASAASSLTGHPNLLNMLLGETSIGAVLLPVMLWQLANQEQSRKASASKDETVALERRAEDGCSSWAWRAAATAAIMEAEDGLWAGEWLRSITTGLCEEGAEECSLANVASGPGAMTCLQIEREGELHWVCV